MIKWNPQKRRFLKHRRNREASREAHLRWKRNRSKMKAAMRRAKVKRKLTMRKNKAMGIYKKLKIARKRFKNILKSDVNMDLFVGNLLLEEGKAPSIDIEHTDLPHLITILKDLKKNIELEDEKDNEDFENFIDDAIEHLRDFDDMEKLVADDEDFLEDIITFIEEYGEELGHLEHDEKKE